MVKYRLVFEAYCYTEQTNMWFLVYNELTHKTFKFPLFGKNFSLYKNTHSVFLNSNSKKEYENQIKILCDNFCATCYDHSEFSNNVFDFRPLSVIKDNYHRYSLKSVSEVKGILKSIYIYPDRKNTIEYFTDSDMAFQFPLPAMNEAHETAINFDLLYASINDSPFDLNTSFAILSNDSDVILQTIHVLQRIGIANEKISIRCRGSERDAIKEKTAHKYKIEYVYIFEDYNTAQDEDTTIVLVKNTQDFYTLTAMTTNIQIVPIWEKDNELFTKELCLQPKVIEAKNQCIKEITQKRIINQNFFGSMHIFSDNMIYTNLKSNSIAQISDSPKNILKKLLSKESMWFFTRKNLPTCSHCMYKNLCPSPSESELVANNFNFCYKGQI